MFAPKLTQTAPSRLTAVTVRRYHTVKTAARRARGWGCGALPGSMGGEFTGLCPDYWYGVPEAGRLRGRGPGGDLVGAWRGPGGVSPPRARPTSPLPRRTRVPRRRREARGRG